MPHSEKKSKKKVHIELISDLTVIRFFLYNNLYRMKLMSVLKADYFDDMNMVEIYKDVMKYNDENGRFPKSIKGMIYRNNRNQPQNVIDEKIKIVDVDIDSINDIELEDYIKDIEKWLKKKAFIDAIKDGYDEITSDDSVGYLDYSDRIKEIEKLSFNNDIGISIKETNRILSMYRIAQPRIKMNDTHWDIILGGGAEIGTLNVIMGLSHTGKTRLMINMAMDYAKKPDCDVLYITLEMSEKKIIEKIDSIAMDLTTDELYKFIGDENDEVSSALYAEAKDKLFQTKADIRVQRYPASSATVADFTVLLNNLKMVDFVPKVIFIDYMGIGAVAGTNGNLAPHDMGKLIAEKYRDFADANHVIVWTSVQSYQGTNKKAKDMNMFDVAQSKAIAATSDSFIIIIEDDNLRRINQQLYKIDKNRHSGRVGDSVIGQLTDDKYSVRFIGIRDKRDQIEEQVSGEKHDDSINNSNHAKSVRENYSTGSARNYRRSR